MAVNVKMGVDLGGFTAGIKQGQAELKTLKAEMKSTEAEFKTTGNSEKALAEKTKNLNSQIKTQKTIMNQAEQAMKQLEKAGVSPTDKAYQQLYMQLLNAKTGMNEAQAALDALNGSQQNAATGASNLAESMNGIGKKVNLDSIRTGLDGITSLMEGLATKAAEVGKALWSEIVNKAKWADDTATLAMMYGIDLETFLKMQKLAVNGLDTSVESMLDSQSKLERGMAAGTSTVTEAMEALGLSMYELGPDGKYGASMVLKDSTQMFWEAGKAIMGMTDAYKQEEYAQALFGRSWKELVPLFEKYDSKEAYDNAVDNVNTASKDSVENLADLNDEIGRLQGNFEDLKTEILGKLAPALSTAADSLSRMLENLMEYLKTPEGKKMLEELGSAVSGLFSDLGELEPEQVVEGFAGILKNLVSNLEWIVDHKEALGGLLEGIFGLWATAKITGGALDLLNLINGLKGLSATSAAAAGASAGASWGSAFAAAVLKSAPWLVGLGILFGNAFTPQGNDDIFTKKEEKMAKRGEYTDDMKRKYVAENPSEFGTWGFDQNGDSVFIPYESDPMEGSHPGPGRKRNITGQAKDWNEGKEISRALAKGLAEEDVKVPVEPDIDIASLQKQLKSTDYTILVKPQIGWGNFGGAGAGGGGWTITQRANGLPWVPYDGYLAVLHRGERVMTARENTSYTYNSNNYFGNVNLNNGMEIDALTESIDRQNRKQRAAYGS